MAQQTKQVQKTEKTVEPVVMEVPDKQSAADKLKADLDAILDEIDEVTESEAQQMVASYIQKGGE